MTRPKSLVRPLLCGCAIGILCIGLYWLLEWAMAGVDDYQRGAWFGSLSTGVWLLCESVYRRTEARRQAADRQ